MIFYDCAIERILSSLCHCSTGSRYLCSPLPREANLPVSVSVVKAVIQLLSISSLSRTSLLQQRTLHGHEELRKILFFD